MAVPCTYRIHCVQADKVKVANTFSEMDTDFRVCQVVTITAPEDPSNAQEITLTVGLWVVAKYDNDEYPRKIISIDCDGIEVKLM